MVRTESRRSGPLDDHVRRGRVYLPPLAATGALQLGDWVRDDLPDLLWPILELETRGEQKFRQFVEWMKAVHADLADAVEPQVRAELLDGRLTGLDLLVDGLPDAKRVIRDRAAEFGLLSTSVARALSSYHYRPAEWLVEQPVEPPSPNQINTLSSAVHSVIRDGHREALVKCLPTWSAAIAGVLRTDKTFIDLLKRYPDDAATRSSADSAIRATWGARRALPSRGPDNQLDASRAWARMFWGTNSLTTRCLRRRETEADDDEGVAMEPNTSAPRADPAPTAMPVDGAHLRQVALDLLASYVEATETAPRDLYRREMYEVHAGLVARAGRDVITALAFPDLWCAEHGSHIGRMLTEVRIYLEWMARQDPEIYRGYQDYGAGKAKLYERILQELPEEARQAGFEDALDELRRLSRNSSPVDIRTVDTRDSFSGKSIRAMAEECGLLDLYRRSYYLASGVAHSEWWSIETHATEPCLNVLHGGHQIASLSLSQGGNLPLARSWVDTFYTLLWRSMQILDTDATTVGSVFAWMRGSDRVDET